MGKQNIDKVGIVSTCRLFQDRPIHAAVIIGRILIRASVKSISLIFTRCSLTASSKAGLEFAVEMRMRKVVIAIMRVRPTVQ